MFILFKNDYCTFVYDESDLISETYQFISLLITSVICQSRDAINSLYI